MLIYILVFIASTLLLYFTNKDYIKARPWLSSLFKLVALLLPIILAGIRSIDVGTDVTWYAKPLYDSAIKATSFSDYLNKTWWNPEIYREVSVSEIEIGFSLMTYLVTKVFRVFPILLMTIEALIILPIYFGANHIKRLKGYSWLFILVYFLTMYNMSFNLMRQFISIAFIFYGMSRMLECNSKKNNLIFFIMLVFAVSVHKAALLGIILYAIFYLYLLINKHFKDDGIVCNAATVFPYRMVCSILIIAFSLVFLFNIDKLYPLFEAVGLEYYAYHYLGKPDFLLNKVIKAIPLLLIICLGFRDFDNKNKDSALLIFFYLFYSLVLSHMASINPQNARIGYIFQIFDIILFPLIIVSQTKRRGLITTLVIGYFSFYWVYTYVVLNTGETIPFVPFF